MDIVGGSPGSESGYVWGFRGYRWYQTMVQVTDSNTAAERFGRRGSAASQDFETGVQNSSDSDWQTGAQNAEGNWAEGVQQAAANGAYGRGVANPSASWQERTLTLGTQRYSQGVQASTGKYQTAVQPYFDALEALSLSPRGARNSAQNYQRSEDVGRRLAEVRASR